MTRTLVTILLFFSLIFSSALVYGDVIVGVPILNPANGHEYYLLSEQSWQDAEAEAQSLGGHLVTINDAAENQWVLETFDDARTAFFWIGFNDFAVEDNFEWASGEATTFVNWGSIEPNNSTASNPNGEDFALMLTETKNGFIAGEWNDGTGTAFGVAEVVTVVPEPGSALLLLIGAVGYIAIIRRSIAFQ